MSEAPSEIVERVARAMLSRDYEVPSDAYSVAWEVHGEYYINLARIAIAAMRSPNEAMIHAGDDAMPAAEGYNKDGDCLGAWRAMIDAALAPEKPKSET